MKKIILIMFIGLLILASCSQEDTKETNLNTETNKKEEIVERDKNDNLNSAVIIYFSSTNTTADIANKINEITKYPIYRIEPVQAYSTDDLNWNKDDSRANKEQNDDASRPEIDNNIPSLDNVSKIYLGFPLWWGVAPKVINTFIEKNNLDDKEIYVFSTSGSSPVEGAMNDLIKKYPNVNFKLAKRFEKGANNTEIEQWLKNTNIVIK